MNGSVQALMVLVDASSNPVGTLMAKMCLIPFFSSLLLDGSCLT